MFIFKLLITHTPFSLVSAGILRTDFVLLHETDNERKQPVKLRERLAPTSGILPDDTEQTILPHDFSSGSGSGPGPGPTPTPPVPLTPLPVESISTREGSTSTTTLVVSVASSTSSTPSATLGTFSTVVSLPSFTFSGYLQGSLTSVESPATTSAPSISADLSLTADTPSSTITSSTFTADNMTKSNTQSGGSNDRTLIITLSTVLSVVGLVILAISLYLCLRSRRRRMKIFNRGVTPIDDDEIASWKVNRPVDEKGGDRFTTRNSTTSNYTPRKARSNSVIQYQSHVRPSIDTAPQSPRSFIHKQSFEVPQAPQTAVLAKAPNARSGLTDDAVPGDQPFVPSLKRQPSKLYKAPPNSAPGAHRARTSRSSSVRSFGEAWYGEGMATSPRTSNDYHLASRIPSRVYSTSTAPPRLSFGESGPFISQNENEPLTTVLSPPPLHRTEIGRAIG